MMKTELLRNWGIAIIITSLVPVLGLAEEEASWNFKEALSVDVRLRWEQADQDGFKESDALTARMRLGLEFPLLERMTGFVEGEFTGAAPSSDYDPYPGAQGEPGRTIIADPENVELNRAYITYIENDVTVIVGRQRIIRNNSRFIGNVGWRQNEQTFDAILANYDFNEAFSVTYGYLDRAIRIFGQSADVEAQRYFNMKSQMMELRYADKGPIDAGIYGYLLKMKNSPFNSSDTYGIWVTGTHSTNENFTLGWRAEMAKQTENSESLDGLEFNLDYFHLMVGFKAGRFGFDIGGEMLDGDGTKGFSTPLATLHAFNGFADVFLVTPAEGLKDFYAKASMVITETVKGALIVHKFSSSGGGMDYGKEVDAVISWKLSDNISFTTKVAFYDGEKDAPFGKSKDVERFWLQADFKY